MKKRKIGLMTLTAFCIGDTIGSGIFATLPEGISRIGSGVIYAWIATILFTIIISIPSLIPSTVLPCPSSSYTLSCRLISPYIGFLEIVSVINYITILAFLGTFFGSYLEIVFPNAPKNLVSIGIILLMWIINLFGVESGTKLQNLIVLVLMVSFCAYIVSGSAYIHTNHLAVSGMLAPGKMKIEAFAVVVGLFYNCMGGCFTQCLVLSNEVKNPEKNLIRSGCITAIFVGSLLGLMSIVTFGITGKSNSIESLGTLAKQFMPAGLWYLFIIGGAWGAMLSTMNAVILSVGYRLDTMAEDGIFPAFFNKKSRFGTKPVCLTLPVAIAIIVIVLDIPLFSLIAINTVLCIMAAVLRLLPVLTLNKKYPHTYKRAVIRLPQKLCYVWVALAAVICIGISISTIVSTKGTIWWAILCVLCMLYLYLLLRIKYLKSRGYDLIEKMSQPYEEWEEREQRYKMEDLDSNEEEKVTAERMVPHPSQRRYAYGETES